MTVNKKSARPGPANQPLARSQSRPGPKLPAWKKTLFGLATACLFFTALELVLALCGARPFLYSKDPFVGFASSIPLFEAHRQADGTVLLQTAQNKLAWFNAQQFPKEKPTGTYRIFCLGGSTTFGRPYDDTTSFCGWLRALLPVADPSRNWEVINAGGLSYASYRVALVMEELARYEPDLFIVYSGHNEFLEQRTYRDVRETPSLVTSMVALLGRTRIYAALDRGLNAVVEQSERAEGNRYQLPGEVDPILEHTVGPRSYTRDDKLRQQIVAHYRLNLGRMASIGRVAGAKVVLVAPASNLRDFSPFKSEHKAGLSAAEVKRWQDFYLQAQERAQAGKLTDAMALLEQAEAIDDRYAELHFRKGQLLYAEGRFAAAKRALNRARDEDVCPLRALTSMLEAVHAVAARQRLPIADFEALIDARSEHAIPGNQQFLDHVHPTIAANRWLALALIDTLANEGIVRLASSWNEAAVEEVVQAVAERLDAKAHAMALLNLSKVLAWAGKFDEARPLAAKASQTLGDNPEAFYLLGLTAEKTGNQIEAIGHYRQALRLMPDFAKAHYNLGVLLDKQGNSAAAVVQYRETLRIQPDHALALNNLANALSEQGMGEQAMAYYRAALRIKPDLAEAHNNLGTELVKQGRNAEGVSHYRKALRIQPHYAEAHNNLGRSLRAEGNIEEAMAHFTEALKSKPDYAEAYRNLGSALVSQGRPAEAIARYRQALRIEPEDAAAHYNLGVILAGQRQLAEAAVHYRQTLRIRPDHADAHNNLGAVLAEQGRLAEAARHFSQALRIQPGFANAQKNLVRVGAMLQETRQPSRAGPSNSAPE
jgi:tetratricopeptide (TPR) repeat protein